MIYCAAVIVLLVATAQAAPAVSDIRIFEKKKN
jgi:hypothetical protein